MNIINPIKDVEPIDTTGAGDLFASGFLFGVINKFSINKCGSLGNKSASEIIKHVRPDLKFIKNIREFILNKLSCMPL